ncbi:haloacid dehalogenase type II [Actinopolymorpha pittospori]
MSDKPQAVHAHDGWIGVEPTVLIFDVNETLIDVEAMSPLFERVFADARVLREWFGQVLTYSMTVTLSGRYEDFFALGRGVFTMLGDIHGVKVTPSDLDYLEHGLRTMPAHPDVEVGLRRLRDAGFRMVTLTNSPPVAGGRTPLEHAGLVGYFERQFSVDTIRTFKPAALTYHLAARELDVPPSTCLMVAAHVWDTIGAQSAGLSAGLLTRPGNAPLPVHGLPQPNIVASDLPDFADRLIARWRG